MILFYIYNIRILRLIDPWHIDKLVFYTNKGYDIVEFSTDTLSSGLFFKILFNLVTEKDCMYGA